MNRRTRAATLIVLGSGIGCQGYNYESPLGPRYAATVPPRSTPAARSGANTIRVVTFNIQYARHIDRAIAVLESSAALRNADIITLQEMDASGTRRIAEALGMSYVYYPATVPRNTAKDFGNAILSRWAIVADQKIVGVPLRVYSVHLGTPLEIGPSSRRDQVRAILADAALYPRVVVSGDMNSRGIGKEFRAAGFLWPTEHNPRTHLVFNWDHVFLKGFAHTDGAGVVSDTLGASDHRPVWTLVSVPVD